MGRKNLFPGMPLLSYRIWRNAVLNNMDDRLHSCRMPEWENSIDIEAYSILRDDKSIAKYTVRRYGTRIERNVFWLISSEKDGMFEGIMQSTGVGGTIWEDSFRIITQQLLVFWLHLRDFFTKDFFLFFETPGGTFAEMRNQIDDPVTLTGEGRLLSFYSRQRRETSPALSMLMFHEYGHISVNKITMAVNDTEEKTGNEYDTDVVVFLNELAQLPRAKVMGKTIPSNSNITPYRARNYLAIHSLVDMMNKETFGSKLQNYKSELMDVVQLATLFEEQTLVKGGLEAAAKGLTQADRQVILDRAYIFDGETVEIELSNRIFTIDAQDYLQLLVRSLTFAEDYGKYQSLVSAVQTRLSRLIECSPQEADLLLEQFYLLCPLLPIKVYRYFKYKLIILEIDRANKGNVDSLKVFDTAMEIEKSLTAEIETAKQNSKTFAQWKSALFGLAPFLLVCSDLFEEAKRRFEDRGQIMERNDCATKQFVVEEQYCDVFATLAHNGVGYHIILPEIERAFAWGDPVPDLANLCYVRAINAVRITLKFRAHFCWA